MYGQAKSIQETKKITKPTIGEIDPFVESLLKRIVVGKHVLQLQKDAPVFSQGDQADAIYFIQSGRVRVTVVPWPMPGLAADTLP